MEFTPEVAPLLDRNRYAIRLAFLLPMALERARAVTPRIEVDLILEVFLLGVPTPVRISIPYPDVRANTQMIVELNPLLRQAGIPPEQEGYIVLQVSSATPGLPHTLKTIGFWVSYRNADVYAVLPSNLQFNSSRVDFGSAAEAHLLDYFGCIRLTPKADVRLSVINPFPIASDVRLEVVEHGDVVGADRWTIDPKGVRWVDVASLLPEDRRQAFEGTIRLISSHRVLWFVWSRDRERDVYYSADHAIPWINRQL